MNKKIALMGYQETNQPLNNRPFTDVMNMIGQNTGNLAFWHAVDAHLQIPKRYVSATSSHDEIHAECDLLVLPAANFINRYQDLSAYTDFLAKIDIPILILGLGVQFELDDDGQDIPQSTENFVAILKDKQATIAVRGDLTANFLSDRGVKDVTVTGCPSNYISPEIKFDYSNVYERTLLNFQIGRKYEAVLPHVGNWIDSLRPRTLIWQGFEDPIAFLRSHDETALMAAFCECLRPGMPLDQFRSWLFKNSQCFFGIREWMEFCARYTLSIGTRFHGNMLAIQSGVPAVFVVHDKRTQEMVDLFSLPSVSLDHIKEKKSLENTLDGTNIDMGPYLQVRQELGKKYFSILKKMQIPFPERFSIFLE